MSTKQKTLSQQSKISTLNAEQIEAELLNVLDDLKNNFTNPTQQNDESCIIQGGASDDDSEQIICT
jgi:hypothetical protein